jgi:hypothetical protein
MYCLFSLGIENKLLHEGVAGNPLGVVQRAKTLLKDYQTVNPDIAWLWRVEVGGGGGGGGGYQRCRCRLLVVAGYHL